MAYPSHGLKGKRSKIFLFSLSFQSNNYTTSFFIILAIFEIKEIKLKSSYKVSYIRSKPKKIILLKTNLQWITNTVPLKSLRTIEVTL